MHVIALVVVALPTATTTKFVGLGRHLCTRLHACATITCSSTGNIAWRLWWRVVVLVVVVATPTASASGRMSHANSNLGRQTWPRCTHWCVCVCACNHLLGAGWPLVVAPHRVA